MKHIVQFSFGEASWYAAKLVAARHGTADLVLLFADTRSEDEDTYRWGRAAAANVGGELVEIADGRDIWQVFRDSRFLGNSRVDPCSRVLKRELCDRWVKERYGPDECVLYVGIGLFEKERFDAVRERKKPYRVEAPLCEAPYPTPADIRRAAVEAGLGVQRLYRMGFMHANCGGVCVKAGQSQWSNLLRAMPARYAEAEAKEAELRAELGADVSILTERRGGKKYPLTLAQFRERQDRNEPCDLFSTVGGCSCFSGDAA